MEYINIWIILVVISIIALLSFWKKRNAVWGGFTGGIIVGIIISLVIMFSGGGFDWIVIGKTAVVGATVGLVAEILGKVGDRLKK